MKPNSNKDKWNASCALGIFTLVFGMVCIIDSRTRLVRPDPPSAMEDCLYVMGLSGLITGLSYVVD